MKDYFYLNPSRMVEVTRKLGNGELKMLWAVIYCLATTGEPVFINNARNREIMAEGGFARTPERTSALLSFLVKKGILKREANAVFSVPKGLFMTADEYEQTKP